MGAAERVVRAEDLKAEVVLSLTARGREELRRPQAGLSLPQRRLLTLIDGQRSLRQISAAEPNLRPERLLRDAARLLGRGLAELEQGWLQPITRPTTVMPQAPSPAAAAVQVGARPRTARPGSALSKGKAKSPFARWGGAMWLLLAAAGAVLLAYGYLMRWAPSAPGAGEAPAPAEIRPISSAPDNARPLADVDAAANRASEPAAAVGAGAPAEGAWPAVASTEVVAKVAAIPPGKTPEVQAAGKPAVRAPTASAATAGAARAIEPVAVPVAAAGPSASATSADEISPAPSDVPAWAREFAPVSPEPDDGRVVAVGKALSPVERIVPVYPREAAVAGIARGSLRARAVLAADGSVERVEFPSIDAGNRVFEQSARAALMAWKFPAGESGRVYEAVLNFVAP
jgi:hypothetical protein